MLRNLLELQGNNHRRWRIALILLLAPFAAYAFTHSGWMSERLGPLAEQRWDFFCLLIAMIGLGIRIHIAGYGQAAEAGKFLPKELHTTGFYSIMRHPVSLANFLILLSGSLLLKNAFFTLLVVIVSCLYYERLMLAKERALLENHGERFTDWTQVTPLILPKFSQWRRPESKFNFPRAASREAITFALIGLMFFVLEALEGTLIDGLPFWEWVFKEPTWIGLFIVSAVILWSQLSRAWAIVMMVISMFAVGVLYFGQFIPARESNDSRAMNALKAGGHVLLMRHALTTGKDQEHVEVNDCSTQRNLSESGREQARRLGQLLSEGNIKIVRTVTSEYCRTQETAQLMGQIATEKLSNLNEQHTHVTLLERLFGNSGNDERIFRPLRSLISGWRDKDTLMLVSHAPVITGLTYRNLGMGEGLVLRPESSSSLGFRVIGKVSLPEKTVK